MFKISFVLPVLNGARYIGRCLDHIEAEMSPGDEIIVVDNGSTDGTVDLLRQRRIAVKVLEHPKLSIAGLRNRGAAVSSGEVLAFIDSDCLIQKGWRAAVVEVLRDPKTYATGSICDLPPLPTWVEQAWSASRSSGPRSVEYIPSANLVIRKDVFVAIQGFDESLITDEDYDIGRRIVLAGGKIIDAPNVRSIHLGNSKTLVQFLQRQKWHATGIWDSLRKHGWDKPMVMTLLFICTCVAAFLTPFLFVTWGRFGLIVLGLPIVAPIVTAVSRVVRNGDCRYLPHLVLLFTLFYIVRSVAFLKALTAHMVKKGMHQ